MSRFIVFFGVATLLVGGLHYYVWARLVRDPALPQPYRLVATVAIIVLALVVPLTMILRRSVDARIADLLFWPAMVWLGTVFFLFFLVLASDLVRVLVWAAGKVIGSPPLDPERRLFLARLAGGAIAAVAALATTAALRNALGRVSVKELQVRLRRLPPSSTA